MNTNVLGAELRLKLTPLTLQFAAARPLKWRESIRSPQLTCQQEQAGEWVKRLENEATRII
jgi:hypothetical protein